MGRNGPGRGRTGSPAAPPNRHGIPLGVEHVTLTLPQRVVDQVADYALEHGLTWHRTLFDLVSAGLPAYVASELARRPARRNE